MPTPCNLKVSEYPGSSEKKGREDTIDIFEVEHSIHQPVDLTTGLATGVRVHSPLRVVAQIDKAMPGLHKALCTGQNMKEAILEYWRIDPKSRSEVKYFTITLTNCRVVDARPYMPMSFVPANESYRHMVQFSFVYEKIEWNWMPDSVVEMDEWRSPGA
jgi:type VI secretion system secreted protein Hcp